VSVKHILKPENKDLKKIYITELSDSEIKKFVQQYKTLTGRKLKYSEKDYIELSKGDPLALNILLTEGEGIERYLDTLIMKILPLLPQYCISLE